MLIPILKYASMALPFAGALAIRLLPRRSTAGYWVYIGVLLAAALALISLLLHPWQRVFGTPPGFSPVVLFLLIPIMLGLAIGLWWRMSTGPYRSARFHAIPLVMLGGALLLALSSGLLIFAGFALIFAGLFTALTYDDILEDIRSDKTEQRDRF